MSHCPCGTGREYGECCGLYLEGDQLAPNPESLMRSRYTAYTKALIDYIERTMKGNALHGFDRQSAETWAKQAEWLGLQIIHVDQGAADRGRVEFIARYRLNGKLQTIHELSEFHCIDSVWYYVAGQQGASSRMDKTGRNEACPCGSGKKFKKCCG